MSKNLTIKIADKLGWKIKETTEAIKNLSQEESIVKDWKQFLNICVSAKTPDERWWDVREYLLDRVSGEDIVEAICKWLQEPDPCFSVWALFNLYDYRNRNTIISTFWASKHAERSLSFKLIDISLEPVELTYSLLCDQFLSSLIMTKSVLSVNRHSLFLQVLSRVGFMAFNITIFRNLASWATIDPTRNTLAKEMASALNGRYSSNASKLTTERQYWLYYVLVEMLREKHGLRGAFREVAKRTPKPEKKHSTIHLRYFERKKELNKIKTKQPDYNLRNIIADYDLAPVLEHYLKTDTEYNMSVNMSAGVIKYGT